MHYTLSTTVCICTPCQGASFTSKTDSFLWGHGPDTLACKARPSFDRCGTSLSVSLSLSLSLSAQETHVILRCRRPRHLQSASFFRRVSVVKHTHRHCERGLGRIQCCCHVQTLCYLHLKSTTQMWADRTLCSCAGIALGPSLSCLIKVQFTCGAICSRSLGSSDSWQLLIPTSASQRNICVIFASCLGHNLHEFCDAVAVLPKSGTRRGHSSLQSLRGEIRSKQSLGVLCFSGGWAERW